VAVNCPECGFPNEEGANYCSRCGAHIGAPEPKENSTATYRVGETGELIPVELDDVVTEEGAALVIRAGGGRVGESFPLVRDRMTIGRRPDCDIFLDDVTVSRDHALLVRRGGEMHIDDLGSLNGTYVNRARIESHRLADGDELQIGKFKLTFLAR
jgi:hypothetical protein